MPEKLKPCPFCGYIRPKIRRFNTNAYRVVCPNCGSQGKPCMVHEWHDTVFVAQNNAKRAWNRRIDNAK